MRHDPKLELAEILTSARTYRFQSTAPLGGWALCTVNDATGELLIMSDWGNWSHLWNPKHLGSPSLTHFISDRRSYDYLANKLLGSRDARVIDADATIKKWRSVLCLRRLEEGRAGADNPPYYLPYSERLDANLARAIWERLGSLFEDESHEALFIEHACKIEGFSRWISEEPWDDTVHRDSYEYRTLVDFLLPAIAEACSQTVKAQAA